MGIEQAAARVQELQALTQSIRGTTTPAAASAVPAAQAAAFTSELQTQLLMGMQDDPSSAGAATPAMGGVPIIKAQQLMQLQQGGMPGAGTQGLGVQALLAGMTPGMGIGAAAPSAPTRLTGKVEGLDPQLRAGLEQVAAAIGKELNVISGHRSRAEQAVLYQKYLNGTGNLAAPPGSSNHESGNAADVYVDGVALANVPGAREAATAAGLGFPVAGEAWHVERQG